MNSKRRPLSLSLSLLLSLSLSLLLLLSLTAACAGVPSSEPLPATAESAPVPAVAETPIASAREPAIPDYLTPAQMEGPYYPVAKPDDRDNDLVNLAGAAGQPEGEVLAFGGLVLDANGMPVPGAVVEIWQTDASGVYLHPDDPGTAGRDPNFQFYGEAVAEPDGSYSFRTIMPGRYEPRPRHIHIKVRLDGQVLLTTQFYFAGEVNLRGDEAALVIDARPGVDAAGKPILVGERDIVLALGVGP